MALEQDERSHKGRRWGALIGSCVALGFVGLVGSAITGIVANFVPECGGTLDRPACSESAKAFIGAAPLATAVVGVAVSLAVGGRMISRQSEGWYIPILVSFAATLVMGIIGLAYGSAGPTDASRRQTEQRNAQLDKERVDRVARMPRYQDAIANYKAAQLEIKSQLDPINPIPTFGRWELPTTSVDTGIRCQVGYSTGPHGASPSESSDRYEAPEARAAEFLGVVDRVMRTHGFTGKPMVAPGPNGSGRVELTGPAQETYTVITNRYESTSDLEFHVSYQGECLMLR